MKKLFRKIMAMVLAVLMVESFLPTCAEDVVTASNGSEVALQDITSNITVTRPSGTVSRNSDSLAFTIAYDINPDKAGTNEDPKEARNNAAWVYDLTDWIKDYPTLAGLSANQGGNVLDGTTVSGTYKITGNRVEIYPNREWLASKGADGIKGTFNLSFQLDKSKIGENGTQEYHFPGSSTTTTVTFEDVDVQTSKTVDGVNNGTVVAEKQSDGTYRLHYNLWIKTDTDLTNLTLTDTLTGSQDFDVNSFHVKNDWPLNQDVPSDWIHQSGKEVTFNLGEYLRSLDASQGSGGFKANQNYNITYDTVIPAGQIGGNETNHATWTYSGNKTTDGGSTNVTTRKSLAVNKSVSETGGNTYTYTVVIGDGTEDLSGHVITDTMSDNQELDGQITVSPAFPGNVTTINPSAQATDSTHSNGNVVLFNYTIPSGADKQYTITYTTRASTDSSLSGTHAITNKTEDRHGNESGESSTTRNHDFGTDQYNAKIDKQFSGWNVPEKKANWTITLTIPDDTSLPLDNVDVQEQWPSYGYGTSNSGNNAVINWESVVVKNNTRTFQYGTDYTIDQDNRKIHFNTITPDMGRSIVITLDTTLPNGLTSSAGGAYIGNTVNVYVNNQYKDSHYAEGKYSSGEISMKKDVSGPDDNGLYTWTVEINPNQDSFNPDIAAYFKDFIPQGMEFAGSDLGSDKISVRYQNGGSWWYNHDPVPFTVSAGNNNMIGPVKLTGIPTNDYHGTTPDGLNNTKIQVTYRTRISSSWKKANNGKNSTFTNKAQVTDGNGTVLKEVTKDVQYVQKYVDKKDTSERDLKDGHATIDYQIDVNPDALTINNGMNAYLTDQIADNVELMTGTIKVIDPSTGKDIPKIPKGISYDDKTRTLTIFVPDSKHVRVMYSVKPQNVSADGRTSETFTNTATLHGGNTWSDEDIKEHVVVNRGATLTGNINQVSLRKVSKYDVKKYLAGAEFTLYRAGLNADNTLNNNDIQVGPVQTSGKDGKVVFNSLTSGNTANKVLYYWKETKAPLGYRASDDLSAKHYFVLYSASNNNQEDAQNRNAADELINAVSSKNNNLAIRRISGADEWVVTNEKESNATAIIKGSKKMMNRAMGYGEFGFTIKGISAVNSDTNQTVTGNSVPLPAQTTVRVPEVNKRVEKNLDYGFEFGEIKYDYPGTFRYRVTENAVSDATVSHDPTAYDVTVTVKRNSDDDLYVDGDPVYEIANANVYTKPTIASFTNTQKVSDLEVTKTVKGNAGDKEKRFSFTITMDPNTRSVVKNATYQYKVTTTGTKVVNPDDYITFKDGVGTFSLASGQTLRLIGIPVGTKYTVSEDGLVAQGYKTVTDNKETLTSDQKTVQENASQNQTSFVNKKDEYGSLKISKKLAGNAVTSDDKNTKEYSFTLHIGGTADLSDAKINSNKLNFDKDRNATVTITGENSVTVSGLPLNAPYTVTENSIKDFSSVQYKAEGKTSDKNASGNVHQTTDVEVTNTRNLYGGISLRKKVSGNDKFKKTWFAFQITLTGDGVPVGQTEYDYKYGDQLEKISFTNGVSDKQNIAGIAEGDFKTKVNDHSVTLKVDKNGSKEYSPELYIMGIPQGVKYTITEDDYTKTYGTVTYTNATGTVKAIDGAIRPESVEKDTDKIAADNKAVIENNRDAYGQLLITKKFVGNAADADQKSGKPINVKLTMKDPGGNPVTGDHFGHVFNSEGSTTITLDQSNNYSVNIEKTIPIGYTYTVEEITKDGYETETNNYVYVTKKDKDGKEIYGPEKDENGEEITNTSEKQKAWCRIYPNGDTDTECANMASDIKKEQPGTISTQWHQVELVNTKYAWGGFSVQKKVTDDENKGPFTFHIELSDNSVNGTNYGTIGSAPITFDHGKADIRLKTDETAYVYGLNDGVHYKVTETDIPTEYSPAYNNAEGNIKAIPFTSKQVKDNSIYSDDGKEFHPEKTADIIKEKLPDENKAVITNVKKTNALTIVKNLTGTDQSVKGPFTFEIHLTNSNGSVFTGNELTDGNGKHVSVTNGTVTAVIDLSNGGSNTFTLNGLPEGTNYTVTETDSKGYTPSYTVGDSTTEDHASGKITNTGNIVNVTNTSNAKGGLIVEKKTQGNAVKASDKWKFELVLSDKTINEISLATESSATDEAGKQLTSLTKNANEDGYVFWLTGGQKLETVNEAIPAGVTYLVEEKKEEGDTYSTVKEGESGVIEKYDADKHNKAKATFTNTRSASYSLTLQKTVNGNTGVGKEFNFEITLTPSDPNLEFNEKVNDVQFTKNKATVKLKDGESKTLTGLPNGSYTVKETGADDYETSVNHSGGDAEAVTVSGKEVNGQFDVYDVVPDSDNQGTPALNKEKDQTVAFTNSKTVYGSLHITKHVTGINADPKARFKFVIRLKGAYGSSFTSGNCGVSGTGFTGEDGKSLTALSFAPVKDKDYSESTPFYLGNEDDITVNNLPSNAAYDVVEENTYSGNTYVATGETGMSGFIPEGAVPAEADVTNTLLSNGKLTLKKEVTGTAKGSGVFYFDLTGKNPDNSALTGTFGDVTFDKDGKTSVAVTADDNGTGETTLTDLPIGTVLTVKERDYTGDGYDTPEYFIGDEKATPGADDGTIQLPAITSENSKTPLVVKTVNTKNLPSLRIKKTIKGLDQNDIPEDIQFHITDGNGVSFDLDYKDFNNTEKKEGKVLKNIPYGIYTVTETGGTVDHYQLETTYHVDSDENPTNTVDLRKEVTTDAGKSERTVEITNTYTKLGGFKIRKNVEVNGENVENDPLKRNLADGTYWFDILDSNGVSIGRHAEITIRDGKSNTASVDDLEAGTYFVQENLEKSTGTHVNEMLPKRLRKVNVAAGVTSEDEKTQTVSITNNLVKPGNLKITKKVLVDGKENNTVNGVYRFKVESVKKEDGEPVYSNVVSIHIENGKSDSVTLDELEPGKYTVTEIPDTDESVPVTVAYDQQEVTVQPEETVETTVTNEYTTLNVHPEIQKFVNGAAEKHSYKFHISAVTKDAPMPEDTTAKAEVSGNRTEPVQFGNIRFTKAGTYEYQITEDDSEKYAGVKNSSEKITAAITIRNEDGTLKSDGFTYKGGTGDAGNVITNTYESAFVTEKLCVTKVVNNLKDADWPADGFRFNLRADPKNPDGAALPADTVAVATIASNKKATFEPITFTKSGTYKFLIQENVDGITPDETGNYVKDNIAYSASTHSATVKIADNHNGQLVVESVTYDGKKDVPSVTNTYGSKALWTPVAIKTVDGQTPEDTYSFALEPLNDNAKKKVSGVSMTSNVNRSIAFDPIGFTLSDVNKEFDFRMKETSKDGNGIIVDTTVHKIKVTVTDNGNGLLNVTPEYDDGKTTEITFDNHAVGSLEVTKKVESVLKGDKKQEFSFHVQLSDQNINGQYGGMNFTGGSADVKLHDGESVKADHLPAGITYVVKEDTPEGFAVTGTGETGTIARGSVAQAVITNTRNTGKLTFTKQFSGVTEEALKNISFTVTGPEGFKEKTYKLSDLKNADGTYSKTLNITVFGDYRVTEKNAGIPGYHVDVTYTVGDQTSTEIPSVRIENGTDVQIQINDAYSQKPVETNLHVTKSVKNLKPEKWPAEGFQFRLSENGEHQDGVELPDNATATATSERPTAAFDAIRFNKAGTYKFNIQEVIPDDAVKDQNGAYVRNGITYSEAHHTAEVNVTDDQKGNLVAKVIYDGRKDVPVVTNTYGATGTWKPTALKTVDGEKPKTSFGFELSAVNDAAKVKLPKAETASNDMDGNIIFDSIGFTQDDVGKKFVFRMKETSKDGNGYITDQKIHEIEVTVKENGDGTLTVLPEYKGEKNIVFNNHAVGSLSLTKKVTGSGDKNRAFHFTVKLNNDQINGKYGDLTFNDGVAETTLKDGQTAKADHLPAGIHYEVAEKEANQDGYVTSNENASGEVREGQDIAVRFTNDKPEEEHPTPAPKSDHPEKTPEASKPLSKKDVTPDTSDHTNIGGWTSLMIAGMAIAVITFITRRKYSR